MELKRHLLWWDVMKILFGTLVTSFAFRYLTFPNNIVAGGITGISQIINGKRPRSSRRSAPGRSRSTEARAWVRTIRR